jgi:hypothetical protein
MKIRTLMLAVSIMACPGVFARDASPANGSPDPRLRVAPAAATDREAPDDGMAPTSAAPSARQAREAYQATVADALVRSDRPRDWALAATLLSLREQPAEPVSYPTRDELLERAARAAPDDAIVQWLAALDRSAAATGSIDAAMGAAAAALTRLEPDNAGAWLSALVVASRRDDAAGVDAALARIASGTRFDDHFAGTLHAWLDVQDRFPPPPAVVPTDDFATRWPAMPTATLQSIVGFAAAFAQVSATAIPGYQVLFAACQPDGTAAWRRRADCEHAGRLMLGQGRSFIARTIGFALLRDLDALTAADQRARRQLGWYQQKSYEATGHARGDAAAIEAYQADWRHLDDEIEVTRRALRRAGLPDSPPAGWIGAPPGAGSAPPA